MTDSQMHGVSIAERLTSGPLEPEKAVAILEQLLEAIGPVHDTGSVHGTISPEKIFLTPDGADLYSLGVVGYATLVGAEPFGQSEGVRPSR